jgi:hypothetical protein
MFAPARCCPRFTGRRGPSADHGHRWYDFLVPAQARYDRPASGLDVSVVRVEFKRDVLDLPFQPAFALTPYVTTDGRDPELLRGFLAGTGLTV